VPTTALINQTIIRNITATTDQASPTAPLSVGAGATLTLTTTVQAANVSIDIVQTLFSNAGGGTLTNPAPGDVLMHEITITNAGNRPALNVVSSNVGSFPALVSISNVDVATDGTTYAETNIGPTGSFTGGTVVVASQNVTVTFSSIANGTSVKYRYKITL
jgi:hypothetical protein